MRILVIDTATERAVTALYQEETQMAVEALPVGLQSSSQLMPAIGRLLEQAHLNVSDLELIIVGVGPGSYTGTRVGVAAAKGLSYPKQIPLVGISTLSALDPGIDGPYAALIDARVSGAYFLLGSLQNGSLTYHTQPAVAPIEEIVPQLKDTLTIVTPFSARLQLRLQQEAPHLSLHWIEQGPDPRLLMRLGRRAYQQGQYSRDAEVDILYLRKTQAEIEKDAL